jgi:hypothetical protein
VQSQRVEELAATAEAEAERLRAEVGNDDGGIVGAITGMFSSAPSDLDRAAEAAENAADARALADMVHAALVDAIATAEQARREWERAERRRSRAEAALTASEYAEQAIAYAQLQPGYTVTGPGQDERNRAALDDWHSYLRSVADAAVVPPALADLTDPQALPPGLEAARDTHFAVSPGIAVADPPGSPGVTVLSAEAVRAVSAAFRRVGVPGDSDITTDACGGLVAEAWTGPDLGPPSDVVGQWESLAPVPLGSVQPGDVVVLGSRRTGLAESGVYVGADQAVVIDATTGVGEVRPLDGPVLGARRVGVGAGHATAPAGGPCGVQPVATSDGPFLVPVPPGSYTLTAGFGDAGSHWSSGSHSGLDFAAPTGTPVVAAAAGTVTVEHPGWAGSLVRIDHGNGLETWYAHLSRTDVTTGQVVEAGTPIGLVGERGNTTGPHLHFEVRLDGSPYDPAPLLGLAEVVR